MGKLSNVNDLERLPRLRRVNRIKSIQSSLAIENNTLSLEQVTDVLNGKRVLGPQDDILAVKNAFAVYKILPELDPFSLEDLKKAHGVMMNGLVERAVNCAQVLSASSMNKERSFMSRRRTIW